MSCEPVERLAFHTGRHTDCVIQDSLRHASMVVSMLHNRVVDKLIAKLSRSITLHRTYQNRLILPSDMDDHVFCLTQEDIAIH